MTLVVQSETVLVDPETPIRLAVGDDLLFSWDPLSRSGGFGREPLGQEQDGIGRTMPDDATFTVIEVLTRDGDLVATKGPIFPWQPHHYEYTAEENVADHGWYESANRFRIVQIGSNGRRTEIGIIYTAYTI